jgi:iron complex outermembrane receptor protein
VALAEATTDAEHLAPAAPADEGAAATGLEEVVVTAQKRSESVQKTAAAVTAVSGASLVASGVTDLRAATALVPSARFQVEGQSTRVFLRGVGNNLDYINIDQVAAFNFNNIYILREGTSAPFYDIAQFEVLPGPEDGLSRESEGDHDSLLSIAGCRPAAGSLVIASIGRWIRPQE